MHHTCPPTTAISLTSVIWGGGQQRLFPAACLLYLDDDLRISQTDAIEKVIAPLTWEGDKIICSSFPNARF